MVKWTGRTPDFRTDSETEAEARRDRARVVEEGRERRAKRTPEERAELMRDAANMREIDADNRRRQARGKYGLDKPSGEDHGTGLSNRERYSRNGLPAHPPVTAGGMTFHFTSDKESWDRGGWGGNNQSRPGKQGTYPSTGDLGHDEKRVIVKRDGSGIFVVGGHGDEYARGTAPVTASQVKRLIADGVQEVPYVAPSRKHRPSM